MGAVRRLYLIENQNGWVLIRVKNSHTLPVGLGSGPWFTVSNDRSTILYLHNLLSNGTGQKPHHIHIVAQATSSCLPWVSQVLIDYSIPALCQRNSDPVRDIDNFLQNRRGAHDNLIRHFQRAVEAEGSDPHKTYHATAIYEPLGQSDNWTLSFKLHSSWPEY